MNYGKLTVLTGPMFAGKTEELLKEILFTSASAGARRASFRVYKPSVDTRYAAESIVSHNGLSFPAMPVSDVSQVIGGTARVVFFDEIQFFAAPHFSGSILDRIRDFREAGLDVTCAGLDMDYLGHAFEITASLMAEASDIRRLSAECIACGAPATHTVRHDNTFSRVQLGGGNAYSAMCAGHWLSARQESLAQTRPETD